MPLHFLNVTSRFAILAFASIVISQSGVIDASAQNVPVLRIQRQESPIKSFRVAGLIGVSIAGPEFGEHVASFSNKQPGELGKDYTFNSPASIQYFQSKGIRLIRLPFRWERVQPDLGKSLDGKQVSLLRAFCRAAKEADAYVVLDLHNYARYHGTEDGVPQEWLIDEVKAGQTPLSRVHFADLWRRLAIAFRHESAVVGYGLMNEPHDMGKSSWKRISQTAVESIRRVDKKTSIIVGGDDWSSAERFVKANGKSAWIRDPSKNTIYEAHCYFDSDGSGKYTSSFADERRRDKRIDNRGVTRVRPFLQWCKVNDVPGFVGEFGTPPEPEWRTVTDRFLRECTRYNVAACYWAAGEWWADYPLSIQPNDDFETNATQLTWLLDSPFLRSQTKKLPTKVH